MKRAFSWYEAPPCIALATLIVTTILGMAPPDQRGVVESEETLKSRGQSFVVDVMAPREPGRHPAVVVLHGHAGVPDKKRSGAHSLARQLAQAGYVALVPHYFGRDKPDPKRGLKNARSFGVWERTVSNTVGFAAKRPDVDSKRIGLAGMSLGSWVALSVGRAIGACRPWWSTTAAFPNGRISTRHVYRPF